MNVSFSLNGDTVHVTVEPRELLIDVLRDRLGLTGTHAGCEQGSCGACTVLVDGAGMRSCLLFAVQVDARQVTTIEGVGSDRSLHAVQAALSEHHGLQCGFCTPGMVLSAIELLNSTEQPSTAEIERWMSGNLCRCTGYHGIVTAIESLVRGRDGER